MPRICWVVCARVCVGGGKWGRFSRALWQGGPHQQVARGHRRVPVTLRGGLARRASNHLPRAAVHIRVKGERAGCGAEEKAAHHLVGCFLVVAGLWWGAGRAGSGAAHCRRPQCHSGRPHAPRGPGTTGPSTHALCEMWNIHMNKVYPTPPSQKNAHCHHVNTRGRVMKSPGEEKLLWLAWSSLSTHRRWR